MTGVDPARVAALEQLAKDVEAACSAPGCDWCGDTAAAYISFGIGEISGDCCDTCMLEFERTDRQYTTVRRYRANLQKLRSALDRLKGSA